jgi:hypothetical protein
MPQLKGGHQLRPVGLATVIRHVPAPFRAGLVSAANLPPRRSFFIPFSRLYYVHVVLFLGLDSRMPISLPQLTAAAGELLLCLLLDSG